MSNEHWLQVGHEVSAELHDVSQGYNAPLENNLEY